MVDEFNRTINYMRISITDRCNLRCKYCMPQDISKLEVEQILTYEEILQIAETAVSLGITHFRITGGEPLVRSGCVDFVAQLKSIRGVQSVTMTTNGVLLAKYDSELKQAGLDGVNVSLDTLDETRFLELTGKDELQQVLAGIKTAKQVGLFVKINTVNRPGLDWNSILGFSEEWGIPVRFIEMMPIGYGKGYMGTSNDELLTQIDKAYGKQPQAFQETSPQLVRGNGPARYDWFFGLTQPVGFISAMNHKFCSQCNRIRLSSEGYLKLCLCYEKGIDLRAVLRGDRKRELRDVMEQAILGKPAEHCFEEVTRITEDKTMVKIGG